MTAQNLPDSDAARHGAGDADLSIMLGAHAAFRQNLISLAQATASPYRPDPVRRAAIQAGWETFKRQLHLHHTAEDTQVWPKLRERLEHSENAQSVLDAMEEEHNQIDPLLAAVDAAFAEPDGSSLGAATDALTTSLTGHLAHEERDGLPLIGVALSAAEWRGVGLRIARQNGLSGTAEMFAWIADGADSDSAAAAIGTLPPPARLIYRAIWAPRYRRTKRW